MDLIDFNSKDFQHWLEEALEAIIKEKVRGVSIACYLDDGAVMESCYKLNVSEMRAIAHTILDDATMLVIQANTESEDDDG